MLLPGAASKKTFFGMRYTLSGAFCGNRHKATSNDFLPELLEVCLLTKPCNARASTRAAQSLQPWRIGYCHSKPWTNLSPQDGTGSANSQSPVLSTLRSNGGQISGRLMRFKNERLQHIGNTNCLIYSGTTACQRPAHVVQWSNHLGAMCSRA